MISMAGKAIRRWWALFALPTFAAFIIGFLVPFIMGVYLSPTHSPPLLNCAPEVGRGLLRVPEIGRAHV